jgi:hypothetical protein
MEVRLRARGGGQTARIHTCCKNYKTLSEIARSNRQGCKDIWICQEMNNPWQARSRQCYLINVSFAHKSIAADFDTLSTCTNYIVLRIKSKTSLEGMVERRRITII